MLHVGTMKSGTSYLQSRMFANRAELRSRGVLIPSKRWEGHVAAVTEVLGDGPGEGRWDRTVARARAFDGTSVISMEFLGPARPSAVRRVVESFAGMDVTVVVTARDLNRNIPAMWQESVQNGRAWSFAEFLADAESRAPEKPGATPMGQGAGSADAGGLFWRQQDLVAIVRNWAKVVGTANTVLLTLPAPGAPRDLLWERWCAVLGVDPSGLEATERANSSLGLASTLVLARVNASLDAAGLAYPAGSGLRKRDLAKAVMAPRASREDRLGLPVGDWVREHSKATVEELQSLGVTVVGEWDDLTPHDVAGISPDDVSAADVADAATEALAGLVSHLLHRR